MIIIRESFAIGTYFKIANSKVFSRKKGVTNIEQIHCKDWYFILFVYENVDDKHNNNPFSSSVFIFGVV